MLTAHLPTMDALVTYYQKSAQVWGPQVNIFE